MLQTEKYALKSSKIHVPARIPVIGRICMDQLLIDVSGLLYVSPGDEAVFIGKCGNEQITAGEFAYMAGTISNEILSRLGSRLDRIIVI